MSTATPGVSAGNVICVCERLGYARWGVGINEEYLLPSRRHDDDAGPG